MVISVTRYGRKPDQAEGGWRVETRLTFPARTRSDKSAAKHAAEGLPPASAERWNPDRQGQALAIVDGQVEKGIDLRN